MRICTIRQPWLLYITPIRTISFALRMSILKRFQFPLHIQVIRLLCAISYSLIPRPSPAPSFDHLQHTQQLVSSSTGTPQAVWIDWVECQVPLRWALSLPADLWSVLLCSEGTTHDHTSYVRFVSSGIATPGHGLGSFFLCILQCSICRIWVGAVIPCKWRPIWRFFLVSLIPVSCLETT